MSLYLPLSFSLIVSKAGFGFRVCCGHFRVVAPWLWVLVVSSSPRNDRCWRGSQIALRDYSLPPLVLRNGALFILLLLVLCFAKPVRQSRNCKRAVRNNRAEIHFRVTVVARTSSWVYVFELARENFPEFYFVRVSH